VTVADVEDPEAAETIDVLATVDVREDVTGVAPFHRGAVQRAFRARFAVFEKSGVDVIAKAVDGFADDPIGLRAIDRGGVNDV
jgi:hypothetical protein